MYGLGIAAQHRTDAFRPIAQQSSQLLLAIAAAPDAHSDGNANATDNAVAALGKVGFSDIGFVSACFFDQLSRIPGMGAAMLLMALAGGLTCDC